MGNSDSQLDEKIAAVNEIADRQTRTDTTVELDKATRKYSERTGVCYGCSQKVSYDDMGHLFGCYQQKNPTGPIWQKFTTVRCLHCGVPSIYESAIGAFCEQHAQEFIAGKIAINPAEKPGWADSSSSSATVTGAEVTKSSEANSGGMSFAVYNMDGTPVGAISNPGGDMTIGQFKAAIMQMEAAQKAAAQKATATDKGSVELVGE